MEIAEATALYAINPVILESNESKPRIAKNCRANPKKKRNVGRQKKKSINCVKPSCVLT